MSKYRVTAPFIPSMGSIAPFFVSSTMSGETKMVEFYDDTHTGKAKTFERGQFVSRYYLATILKGSSNPTENGINLCGGVPEWVVSATNVRDAVAYAITKAKGE